jgi:hypothetical protein
VHEIERGTIEEIGDAFAVARPQVARIGTTREVRDVGAGEVAMFGVDNTRKSRTLVDSHPQPVEETIAVERVAQQIGMHALRKEQTVGARGPKHHAHGVGGECRHGAARSEQRVALARDQTVHVRKTGSDLIAELKHVERTTVEVGTVVGALHLDVLAHRAHFVGAPLLPVKHAVRTHQSFHRGDAAEIDSAGRIGAARRHRQEPDAQYRSHHQACGQAPVVALRFAVGKRGMENGFEIHRHRLVSVRDDILEVTIHAAQRVQRGQKSAHAPVVAACFVERTARLRVDKLQPPVAVARHHSHGSKRRTIQALVDEGEELLEVEIDVQRPWLVDQPRAGFKGRDHDSAAAAVRIADVRVDIHQKSRVCTREKRFANRRPVCHQPLCKLGTRNDRVVDVLHHTARKHRIRGKHGGRLFAGTERAREVLEACLRRVALEITLELRDVQLQHQCALDGVEDAVRDDGNQLLGGAFDVDGWPARERRQRGAQPAARRLQERAHEVQKACGGTVVVKRSDGVTRGASALRKRIFNLCQPIRSRRARLQVGSGKRERIFQRGEIEPVTGQAEREPIAIRERPLGFPALEARACGSGRAGRLACDKARALSQAEREIPLRIIETRIVHGRKTAVGGSPPTAGC